MPIPRGLKIAGIVLAGVFVLLLIIVTAGWYWWAEVRRLGEQNRALGVAFGRDHVLEACLERALERYTGDPGFNSSIGARLFVSGCLETSESSEAFCDAVPASDDLVSGAQWRVELCERAGVSDSYCPQIPMPVHSYCDRLRGASSGDGSDAAANSDRD